MLKLSKDRSFILIFVKKQIKKWNYMNSRVPR